MNPAHMGGWTGGAWLLLLVFLAILATGVVLGISRLAAGRPSGRAEKILDERFARGEIDAEEHRARRSAISGTRGRTVLPVALALAFVGLAGTLVVAAVAPGSGHGFMHMMGGMGSMMMRGDEGRSGSPPVSGAREVRVAGREFSFEPSKVRLRVDESVNIVFDNRGMMFHTLTVGGLGLDLRADGRDSISGSVRPDKPGTYSFVCAVPGHAEAGMRGTIEVE